MEAKEPGGAESLGPSPYDHGVEGEGLEQEVTREAAGGRCTARRHGAGYGRGADGSA